jgi:hypothetical protein
MRIFVLVLNILVGSTILLQSTDILAASVTTDALNSNNPSRHLKTTQQKRSKSSGDLWARIRLGMKIPQPTLTTTNPEMLTGNTSISYSQTRSKRLFANQQVNQQQTAITPLYRATAYGRLKHNALMRRRAALQEHPITLDNTDLSGTQTRIHTQIVSHSQLTGFNTTLASNGFNSNPLSLKQNDPKNSFKQPVINTHTTGFDAAYPIQAQRQENTKFGRIHKHITWYQEHRDYLSQVTERARPYLYHIVESLNQHHLPYELALLPIIESAYQPTALSPKSAAGLWQFIPSTGHDFDLQQTIHYDARLDITASTQAAMRYLTFLNQHFNGDWLLALAAYNCGLGAVDNAINRNKAEGLAIDYWSLRLPEETQEYVPRFLALSSIFANPDFHNLKLARIKNEPYFVKVKIHHQQHIDYLTHKDFKQIAQIANLSYEQFTNLNPGYLNPALANDKNFTFLMPAANADHFHRHLESIAQFMNQPPTMTTRHTPLKNKDTHLITANQHFEFITLFN